MLNVIAKIGIAYMIDLIAGDPYWMPHPVQFIGKLIEKFENILYRFKNKRFSGAVLTIMVLSITFMISYTLGMFQILEIYFLYTIFATRCLAKEGMKVYNILKAKDMERAKKELSYLVSRDTGSMDERNIIRSVMETISENTVDGIIAPMFYMMVGALVLPGNPGAALAFGMTYKGVNTLDSMVGYKNERYSDFGWFSARLDDWVNLIPARITGMIFYPLSAMILGLDYKSSFRIYFRDRLRHASPNAGHPESAVAGAIGIQFGGVTSYFGKSHEKPTIGDKVKDFDIEDIRKNIKMMYGASIIGMIFFMGIIWGVHGFFIV
ncbi:adenosylcobinamide-phosphate synthase CbiB [uncultured Ilyobacter sp.]|uniref:adenosylcobinamide-phosphate synthase CbiB n=1 Tax=uncultured Ilyobacter sp. TaxID=544433 RepID=UPI0029C028EE|nr:adenosylcobinamide-phosphate synthase CbiB [uncultured Ilyobacter sp.]